MPVEVLVPPLGTTVGTLKLVTWYVREGEPVEKDQPLFAVETDKAVLDVEAPASGVLRRVAALPGAEVTELACIALILAPGEVLEPARQGGTAEARGEQERAKVRTEVRSTEPSVQRCGRILISPRARRLAESVMLDWSGINGTGPDGAIVQRDIAAALEADGGVDTAQPDVNRRRASSPWHA